MCIFFVLSFLHTHKKKKKHAKMHANNPKWEIKRYYKSVFHIVRYENTKMHGKQLIWGNKGYYYKKIYNVSVFELHSYQNA